MDRKKIIDLHKQHEITVNREIYHLTYAINKKEKRLEFLGYRCIHCNKLTQSISTVAKHDKGCAKLKFINRERKREYTEPAKIVTTTGEIWKPLEIYQNHSFDDDKYNNNNG